MKKRISLVLSMIALLASGCWNDYPQLGSDYVFCNRIIARTEKIPGKCDALHYLITEQVLNYNFDSEYIVAYQIPVTSYLGSRDAQKKGMNVEQIDSLDRQFEEMLRIHDCYWIIWKEDCVVFGPMTKHDFEKRCGELSVSVRLDPRLEKELVKYSTEDEDILWDRTAAPTSWKRAITTRSF